MQKQKSGEKRGRSGNTYDVNEVWWMRGGRRGGGVRIQIHSVYVNIHNATQYIRSRYVSHR